MTLDAKRKRVVAVLGLCGAALLLDKVILAPSEADGSEQPLAAALVVEASERPQALATPEPAISAPERSLLIARLAEHPAGATDLDRAASAFGDPAGWFSVEEAVVADQVVVDPESPHAAFVKEYRLTAIMSGAGGGGGVLLNQRFVRMGQTVAGYALREIGERSAVFESSDGRVVLTLLEAAAERPGPRGDRSSPRRDR